MNRACSRSRADEQASCRAARVRMNGRSAERRGFISQNRVTAGVPGSTGIRLRFVIFHLPCTFLREEGNRPNLLIPPWGKDRITHEPSQLSRRRCWHSPLRRPAAFGLHHAGADLFTDQASRAAPRSATSRTMAQSVMVSMTTQPPFNLRLHRSPSSGGTVNVPAGTYLIDPSRTAPRASTCAATCCCPWTRRRS